MYLKRLERAHSSGLWEVAQMIFFSVGTKLEEPHKRLESPWRIQEFSPRPLVALVMATVDKGG